MRKNLFAVLCILLSGCVTVTSEPENVFSSSKNISRRALTNINQVRNQMTKSEVSALMGQSLKVGYQQNIFVDGAYEAILVQSPFRSEVLENAGKSYDVVYYFTHVQKADDIVSEDELTPVVFKENRVIGKGMDFLFTLKQSGYESKGL